MKENVKKKQLNNIQTYVNYVAKELYDIEEDEQAMKNVSYMVRSLSKTTAYDFAIVNMYGKVILESSNTAGNNHNFNI